MGWVGLDLCAGLFYEHRFAMLIMENFKQHCTFVGIGECETHPMVIFWAKQWDHHNPPILKRLSSVNWQSSYSAPWVDFVHLAFLNLCSTKEETNPSAPGQQILGLIGDKSDGSARRLTVMLRFQGEIKSRPHRQSWREVELNQPPLKQSGGGGANSGAIRPNCDAALSPTKPKPPNCQQGTSHIASSDLFFVREEINRK